MIVLSKQTVRVVPQFHLANNGRQELFWVWFIYIYVCVCVFEVGHMNMQYVLFSEICDACLGKESWLWTVGCTAWSRL